VETPPQADAAGLDPQQGPARTRAVDDAPTREIDYEGAGLRLMQACIDDASSNHARLLRDRADIQNCRFERGGADNQWTVWDEGTGRYVPRGYDPEQGGLPAWVPRPVTNVFASVIRGLTAILDQSEPAQVFAPATESDEDRATSEVADDAVPVLRDECGYDSQGHRHELNKLAALTDKSAYVVFYDNDARHGMADIELFQCPCGQVVDPLTMDEEGGACPNCGETDTETFALLTDPNTGMPIGMPMPIGRMCGEVLTSLEFSLPSAARYAHAQANPWILGHRRMSPNEVARMWPGAKTVAYDRKQWSDGKLARAYADELRHMASPAASTRGGSGQKFEGPVVYRIWHDPIDTDEFYFPQGFYGVKIGDKLVEAGPLPFKDGEDTPFKNVILRTWEQSPGSPFGHPPADDLVPIQQSRNTIEAMIELIVMTDAAPTRYIPESVTLIDEPTGVPGEWVRYRSIDGSKPTETRGMAPPPALFEWLDRKDQKMQEVSGLNSVLAGSRPDGDPTLGEVQILEERGMATFRSPLDHLIEFEKELSFMLLSVGRQTLWSPRFRRIRGENKQWEVKQFASADLSGQIDITVERASAWPKSPLLQQLRLKQALEMGVLPPPAQDPEISGKLLVDMNLAHLKQSWDADRRQVARLLDRWKEARTAEEIAAWPPDQVTQNLEMHGYLLTQWLKSEEAEDLMLANPSVFQACRQHVEQIQQLQMMKAMQQAQAQQGGQPPQEPATGASGTLDAAMQAGALVPADAAAQSGQGPSVDDLVQAQILTPVLPEPEAGGAGDGAPPVPGMPVQ